MLKLKRNRYKCKDSTVCFFKQCWITILVMWLVFFFYIFYVVYQLKYGTYEKIDKNFGPAADTYCSIAYWMHGYDKPKCIELFLIIYNRSV